jgi:fused signal recognition particle receptor
VARTWQQLFVTENGSGFAEQDDEQPKRRGGFFSRLRQNLKKTREAFSAELADTIFQRLDEQTWERLEEMLIEADVGVPTTAKVVGQLEQEAAAGSISQGDELKLRLEKLLASAAASERDTIDLRNQPTVIVVVGVNGTGKTTTIGKLAWHLKKQLGRSVVIAAADTFRAAAVEQLTTWAERAECDIVKGSFGSDPGAVAYDAIDAARARGHDVVICDTAGRLHTQQNLMSELSKVSRVIQKQISDAPHETLLTIDATTGQNGLRQAQMFREAVEVTGIVLTKLDGTAKGGIALAIASELGLPVKLIGVGEQIDDLRPFDPEDFAAAMLDTQE